MFTKSTRDFLGVVATLAGFVAMLLLGHILRDHFRLSAEVCYTYGGVSGKCEFSEFVFQMAQYLQWLGAAALVLFLVIIIIVAVVVEAADNNKKRNKHAPAAITSELLQAPSARCDPEESGTIASQPADSQIHALPAVGNVEAFDQPDRRDPPNTHVIKAIAERLSDSNADKSAGEGTGRRVKTIPMSRDD